MTKFVVLEGEQFEQLLEHTRHWIRRGFEEMAEELDHAVEQIIAALNPAQPATGLRLTIGGNMADTTLNVDVTGEQAVAQWVDDKGDVTTIPPNGPDGAPATFHYSSSDETVATVDATGGALTFLKAGTVVITASAVDSTGAPLAGFPQATANLILTPGTATALEVSVEGAAPVPAPTPPPDQPPVAPPVDVPPPDVPPAAPADPNAPPPDAPGPVTTP